jgi:hypothetical protein
MLQQARDVQPFILRAQRTKHHEQSMGNAPGTCLETPPSQIQVFAENTILPILTQNGDSMFVARTTQPNNGFVVKALWCSYSYLTGPILLLAIQTDGPLSPTSIGSRAFHISKALLTANPPADINIRNDFGLTPLGEACELFGCPERAKFCLEWGADIHRRTIWDEHRSLLRRGRGT